MNIKIRTPQASCSPSRHRTFSALLGAALSSLTLSGLALGAGFAPVPGSALPDAWARAGASVTLNVPEVQGKVVTVGGVPAQTSRTQVTLRVPASTAPGRVQVRFVGGSDQLITTRDIEVLGAVPGAATPVEPATPEDRHLQLLLNPRLNAAQVQALLTRLLPGIGTVSSLEQLPPSRSGAAPTAAGTSPCGGMLADVQLQSGVLLEEALNALLQGGNGDIWYPDPISVYRAPALGQSAQAGPPSVVQTSFGYVRWPVLPTVALGHPATRGLTGAGVTIAVLDTGFTAALDTGHELTDAAGTRLNRVKPPINALVPYPTAQSLIGAGDFWEGHGTQVAILAAGNVSGVASGAEVLPIKVCSEGSGRASCNTRDVLRGLCVALNRAAANRLVINLSLGGHAPTGAIHAVLNWASSQGAVVVAAGGNGHGRGALGSPDPEEYPAAFARSHAPSQVALPLLAVASTTPGSGGRTLSSSTVWKLSPFSTLGSYLNISAPGEALDLGHDQVYSGTSFAAPLVAGAAALLRQASLAASTPTLQTFMTTGSRVAFYGLNTGGSTPVGLPMLRLGGY